MHEVGDVAVLEEAWEAKPVLSWTRQWKLLTGHAAVVGAVAWVTWTWTMTTGLLLCDPRAEVGVNVPKAFGS